MLQKQPINLVRIWIRLRSAEVWSRVLIQRDGSLKIVEDSLMILKVKFFLIYEDLGTTRKIAINAE